MNEYIYLIFFSYDLLYKNSLIPTSQYYPLRFHILKSMASLCEATRTYITLAPYVLEVLDSAELKNKAKPSTAKPLDWDINLRAPKPYLRGRVYQVKKNR